MMASAKTRAANLMGKLFPGGAHSSTFQQEALELAIQEAQLEALEAAARLADVFCRMPLDPGHPMTISTGPTLRDQIRALRPQGDR